MPSGSKTTKEKGKKNMIESHALGRALSQIEKAYGKGSIMRMGSSAIVDIDTIPTGSIGLDCALGIGGLPRGRVVEIFGPEMSGKTTLTLHCMANAQKAGGVAAFIDAEHAIDPAYANQELAEDVSDGTLVVDDENPRLGFPEQIVDCHWRRERRG